jgi:ankyrin repeat protein
MKESTMVKEKSGANTWAKNRQGNTPLHLSAANGSRVIVEALIARGVDLQARNQEDQTALMLAEARGHIDVVQLLTSHGG